MANGLDVDPTTLIAANDRYSMDQEGLTTNEDDVDHLDCDTIPFMWSWAKNFVLFDNFHQTIVGPSTPNAIAFLVLRERHRGRRVPIMREPLDQLLTYECACADEQAVGKNAAQSRAPKCFDQPVTIELVVVRTMFPLDPDPSARFEALQGLVALGRGHKRQHERDQRIHQHDHRAAHPRPPCKTLDHLFRFGERVKSTCTDIRRDRLNVATWGRLTALSKCGVLGGRVAQRG